MDTCGGANSGNTSSRASARVLAPYNTSAHPSPTTTPACRIAARTSDLSISGRRDSLADLFPYFGASPELLGKELLGTGHDDRIARYKRRSDDPSTGCRAVGGNRRPSEASSPALQIGPGKSLPLDHRSIGNYNTGARLAGREQAEDRRARSSTGPGTVGTI